ncbi:MAG: hypothetical protein KDG50_14770 [Chromatiales bacterium]|nr:hypothetical protein [Chromatiales bacterium]
MRVDGGAWWEKRKTAIFVCVKLAILRRNDQRSMIDQHVLREIVGGAADFRGTGRCRHFDGSKPEKMRENEK